MDFCPSIAGILGLRANTKMVAVVYFSVFIWAVEFKYQYYIKDFLATDELISSLNVASDFNFDQYGKDDEGIIEIEKFNERNSVKKRYRS